jgi:outer membrane protein assembly factor BamB
MGPATDDIYTEFWEGTMQWYAFNMHTGSPAWGPTDPYPKAFGMYSWQASIAYGMLLGLDFGGYVHAYNINTGKKVWDFYAGPSGLETAYGSWPLNNPAPTSADGKIYVVDGHAYNPPIYKGASIYCINATDGTLIWKELGFYTYNSMEIAAGDLVTYNCYDAQVYCYGPGKSATTVSAPEVAVPQGTPVLLKGTVVDQSPGNTCLGIPAASTPAISDDSMTAWQAYLYMQQPKPTNATGVPVHLTAIDPNGNWQDLGTAISDDHGMYSISYVPPVPGMYKVTATFAGTNSYFASDAETAFIVSKSVVAAPAATAAPTAIPTQAPTNAPTATVAPTATIAPTPSPVVVPPATGMPTTTYIAISAVIIIVLAAAAALILRRRK